MTGAYVRVERDGKFENIEVEYLTEEELELFFKDKDKEEILNWFYFTLRYIRNIESQLKVTFK